MLGQLLGQLLGLLGHPETALTIFYRIRMQ